MPGFVTHYLFGIDTYKRLNDTLIRKNLRKNHGAYALGLQGPDIFFYYLPSHIFHRTNLGALAHEKNTGAFFSYLIESRSQFAGHPHMLDIADAYILGFIGHYTLDCTVHPYVYSFTGYHPQKAQKNSQYFGQHAYFETEIDNRLLYQKKELYPSQFYQHKTISLSILQRFVITRMLIYAYHNTYPDVSVSAHMIWSATCWMKLGTKILRDPSGQKKVLIRFIEKLLFNRPFISPMVPSNLHTFVKDCMNSTHKKWIHPWTGAVSTESFPELYEKAEELYLKRISSYYQMLHDGCSTEALSRFTHSYGNRSFLSGEPLC